MLVNCLPHIVLYTFPTYCNQLHRKQIDENGKALLGCLQDYQEILTHEVGNLLIYFSNTDYNSNDIPQTVWHSLSLLSDITWNSNAGFLWILVYNLGVLEHFTPWVFLNLGVLGHFGLKN